MGRYVGDERSVDGFDELMPKTIANATVDRRLHHAHVVLTAGDASDSPKPPAATG